MNIYWILVGLFFLFILYPIKKKNIQYNKKYNVPSILSNTNNIAKYLLLN